MMHVDAHSSSKSLSPSSLSSNLTSLASQAGRTSKRPRVNVGGDAGAGAQSSSLSSEGNRCRSISAPPAISSIITSSLGSVTSAADYALRARELSADITGASVHSSMSSFSDGAPSTPSSGRIFAGIHSIRTHAVARVRDTRNALEFFFLGVSQLIHDARLNIERRVALWQARVATQRRLRVAAAAAAAASAGGGYFTYK